MKCSVFLLLAGLFVGTLKPGAGTAQVVGAPTVSQTGTSQPISSEPAISRTTTTPCTLTLFSNLPFTMDCTRAISYTPSSGSACASPWATVILTADITIASGRQFDHTAQFFLWAASIYLTPPQAGVASIQNVVSSTYAGLICGSVTLVCCPANATPAPVTQNAVLSLASNTAPRVSSTTDKQAATFVLPRNITRAYPDVISQAQSSDKCWYTCVPNNFAGPLAYCGNSGSRETEITIDGIPAGVAPVYARICTDRIDPYP